MEYSQAIVLHGNKRCIELREGAIVSIPGSLEASPPVPDMAKLTAKIRAMTIAMVGLLAMPLCGLMAGDENLWAKLQALIETERVTKTQSTVLAVDTLGLSVRSKSASASTKELFEQAAMEHLARLHHTFNSWSDRKQELMGSVSLKLMVDASGNVVRVEPMNSHVNNSSFVKTVIDDVREWKFPKGSAEAAEITVPLLFIPKGMDPEMIVQWERTVRRAPGDDDSPGALAIAPARPATKVTEKALDIAAITPMQKEQKSVAAAPAQPQIAAKPIAVATGAPTAKAKAQAKAIVVVVANRPLAMRDNPRYSANSVREVQEATQLSILEHRGDWLKVRSAAGGQVGFVRKEYVSPLNG
ncbi:MAG: AgmX/PglI C-terminal domain-containing protein [Candidatus Binatota bacterium]|nr:AgmX/PglI C-terminal domain-containing protein [Candidatus Binatota bacterium]